MSWKIFQHWFNCPTARNSEYITDNSGEKFWISWDKFDEGLFLYINYRGNWIGTIESYWCEDGSIELTDIIIFEKFNYLRERGLGKKMSQCFIALAKKEGARFIHGCIVPHQGSTMEFLVDWYRRQGFLVNGSSIYLDLTDNN